MSILASNGNYYPISSIIGFSADDETKTITLKFADGNELSYADNKGIIQGHIQKYFYLIEKSLGVEDIANKLNWSLAQSWQDENYSSYDDYPLSDDFFVKKPEEKKETN